MAELVDAGRESVMKGHGYYSEHSRVQHAAAAPAFPQLERAAAEVPLLGDAATVIGDFGCAGGRNEMEPMRLAIAGIRARDAARPIQVVHSDLPSNDFASLFQLLYGSPDSYLAGTHDVFASATGRTLYESVLPSASLTLGWTGITVHWLSSTDGLAPDAIYPNLTTGAAREQIRERSRRDWEAFLAERARELRPGGQVVVVGGASRPDGTSGAEGLFGLATEQLRSMVSSGELTAEELDSIYYPTWNRTETEFLEPLDDASTGLTVEEHRFDGTDDAVTYPQYARDGDAEAFADVYLPFVRAITEPSFFRWLSPTRTPQERRDVVERFYEGLRDRMAADPATATCHWHVVSIRLRRT